MGRARWLALICLALACTLAQGQARSQICLSAFADENENGIREAGELPITRGIAASLLDERGLTINTALLNDSPYAADGLLCFDDLLAGKYRLIISGSELIATGATTAEAMLLPGEPPPVIDFGGRSLIAEPGPAVGTRLDADATRMLLLAAGGLALAVALLSLLGCLLAWSFLRRRYARAGPPRIESAAGTPPLADDHQGW